MPPSESSAKGLISNCSSGPATVMIAAVLVGLLIGWALDRVLDTTPWLLVLFVFLGAGAGGLNAYRVAKGYDSAVGLGRAMREHKQGDGK
jgi:ATP synthase protein I